MPSIVYGSSIVLQGFLVEKVNATYSTLAGQQQTATKPLRGDIRSYDSPSLQEVGVAAARCLARACAWLPFSAAAPLADDEGVATGRCDAEMWWSFEESVYAYIYVCVCVSGVMFASACLV